MQTDLVTITDPLIMPAQSKRRFATFPDPEPTTLESKIDNIFDKLITMLTTISELVTGRDQDRAEMQGAEVKLHDLEGRLEEYINWDENEEQEGDEHDEEDGGDHTADATVPEGPAEATSKIRHRSKSPERTHQDG